MKAKDYTGMTFGLLTAIEPTEEYSGSEGRIWLWKCNGECGGNTILLPIERVKQGRTKSCGCLSKTTADRQRKDITGQVFGRLTAIRPTELRNRKEVVWEFRCDCGNTVYRAQNLVSRGGCNSCGCLGRENQEKMYENKYAGNHVMGTNLKAIAAREDQLSKYNKTGAKGVFWDESKGHYVAHLGFQGEKFRFPCRSFREARFVRKNLKMIHEEFLKWWNSLSELEQAEQTLLYENEKNAQLENFRTQLLDWKEHFPMFFTLDESGEGAFSNEEEVKDSEFEF